MFPLATAPIHNTGTIYRLAYRHLERNDKEVAPTADEILKIGQQADKLTSALGNNSTWLSVIPYNGERLLITGTLAQELNRLFSNLPHETCNEMYNELRQRRFLDILI